MEAILSRILETDGLYVLALVFVSIQAFGVGLMIGFAWVKFF
jgi:hypothetical protein